MRNANVSEPFRTLVNSMSKTKIKRFEPNIEGTQYDTGPYAVMNETVDGPYVHYDDHVTTENQRNALLAALEDILDSPTDRIESIAKEAAIKLVDSIKEA